MSRIQVPAIRREPTANFLAGSLTQKTERSEEPRMLLRLDKTCSMHKSVLNN